MLRLSLLLVCVAAGPAFAAPVSSLAYSPDGSMLAVGEYGRLHLVDPAKGEVAHTIAVGVQRLTAIAYNHDGSLLAVASGEPGKTGMVHLFDGKSPAKPLREWQAHKDIVLDLKFQPRGNLLATTGYDRLIRLWNPADATLQKELTDHSDAVYGLSFHPDGKLLASCSADRAVKIWEVASGKRLYSLGDSTDWLYAVAWHPDGKRLAAGGVDKSIRVWEADAQGGRIVQSVFAHTQPVSRLVYAKDGSALFSIGEGPNVKHWDPAKMTEKAVFMPQSETMLGLALSPEGKQVAIGRFDGVLQLLDSEKGTVLHQPLPRQPAKKPAVKPKAKMNASPPSLLKLHPDFGVPGTTIQAIVEGPDLENVTAVASANPMLKVKILDAGRTAGRLPLEIAIDAQASADAVELSIGKGAAPFFIDRYSAVVESDAKDSSRSGTPAKMPATLVGSLNRAGDVDYFRFEAYAGQEFGVQVITPPKLAAFEPVLEVTDADGRVLVERSNKLLAFKAPKKGTYAIAVRDKEYRGGEGYSYRVHVGDFPVIAAVHPLGVPRGKKSTVRVLGVNMNESAFGWIDVPADAKPGMILKLNLSVEKALGNSTVIVGEFPEYDPIVESGTRVGRNANPVHQLPITINDTLYTSGTVAEYRFQAKKGQPLVIETNARRLGSELDSVLEIVDEAGKPVHRATLRCTARTFTALRDIDAVNPKIRLEGYNELAMRDYIYVGNQVLRIDELPKHPDSDCPFEEIAGNRRAYFGTTAAHIALGSPMYKVELHPPGKTFPPNGMPVFPLLYRNDDGGAGYGRDSRIDFDPPADGVYTVRVSDSRGKGGEAYGYRLTIRPPAPSFTLAVAPATGTVPQGGGLPVTITATRIDGFEGPIAVKPLSVPPGLQIPTTIIEQEQTTAMVVVSADAAAKVGEKLPEVMFEARAMIDGKETIQRAKAAFTVGEAGDIVTTLESGTLAIHPGKEMKFQVTIERKNGFTGRIPLDVRGLPYGVRTVDIGLNGILVLPNETSRSITLYCEPWVKSMEHPIVVTARREGKNVDYAVGGVTLKIGK